MPTRCAAPQVFFDPGYDIFDGAMALGAGLADPSWSSLHSYNYPDRHIRHFDYVLRIDPISTAAGRADATFSVWY